jgi:hypothetical protein
MILKRYSQLTNEQRTAISFIESTQAGGLWADCGCGKTVVLLTALNQLRRRFDVHRVLVVGPRLVAERVWSAEAAEWEHLTHLKVVRITGSPTQRIAALGVEADIYTVTRDNVAWLHDQYIRTEVLPNGRKKYVQYRPWPFDTLVLDESQSFKDQGSQRSKAVRRIRKLCARVYLATGSFIPNGYQDAWHQAYLIDGGKALGSAESDFKRRWFRMELNDGIPTYEILPHSAKEIDERLASIIHVVRDAQPPAPKNFIRVELSKEELARYNRMVRTSVFELAPGTAPITAVNAGVLYGKLLQLANGAIYDEQHNWHLVHDRKIEALMELLESLPRPVLIGYSFVHDVERLRRALEHDVKGAGARVGVLRTSASLDAWRRGDIQIGIMHPASAGHGLNDLYVSGCRHLVWFGFTANREHYDQLNGRLAGGHRRTGRTVCIHHLVAEGTIDTDAQVAIDFKGEQQVTSQIRVLERIRQEVGK